MQNLQINSDYFMGNIGNILKLQKTQLYIFAINLKI